jgi:hypothetical protein
VTSEPFFSYLGSHKTEETVRQLLQYAEASNVTPMLRLITEESIAGLQAPDLHVKEDKNNFDYIFSVPQLASPRGIKLKQKRHLANRFIREHPEATFVIKKIGDVDVQTEIIAIFDLWERKKKLDNKPSDLRNERSALERLLKSVRERTYVNDKLFLSCVFLRGVMLGFGIDEILPHKYAMSHFIKADSSFKGTYEFINEQISQYLESRGTEFWNWQQDLNIDGLRAVKKSYRPVDFFKKYVITHVPMKVSAETELVLRSR